MRYEIVIPREYKTELGAVTRTVDIDVIKLIYARLVGYLEKEKLDSRLDYGGHAAIVDAMMGREPTGIPTFELKNGMKFEIHPSLRKGLRIAITDSDHSDEPKDNALEYVIKELIEKNVPVLLSRNDRDSDNSPLTDADRDVLSHFLN